MSALQLDLNNLTPGHLEEARPNCNSYGCMYASPCIIGTLIPKDQREHFDNPDENKIDEFPQLGALIDAGLISLPAGQRSVAEDMQSAFDEGDWETVEKLAAPYVLGKELAA